MVEALVNNYWISPTALYIQRNAMGKPDYIQANVVAGATILCYIAGVDGLGYDAGHNYQSWQLSIAPTVFNTTSEKYVYVKIPKPNTPGATSRIAQFAFPSEHLDLYGQNENGDQIGSTDYFYIFTQGILSASVDGNGVQQDRVWLQELQTGTLSSDEARSAESDWYSYNRVTEVVSFLKGINMSNANATFHNLAIGQGNSRHVLTGVAKANTPETSNVDIVTPSYIAGKFLSKVNDDEAEGLITFKKGAIFGPDGLNVWGYVRNVIENGVTKAKAWFQNLYANYLESLNAVITGYLKGGANGLLIQDDVRVEKANGQDAQLQVATLKSTNIENSDTVKTHNLIVTGLAHFFELIIDKIRASGGAEIKSAAEGFKVEAIWECELSLPYDPDNQLGETVDARRLYFLAKDPEGRQRIQSWKRLDQAICMTFNASAGTSYNVSNKYFWALVGGVSETPVEIEIDGETVECHYIDIYTGDGTETSAQIPVDENGIKLWDGLPSAVAVGDEIAMLGYRGTDEPARQSAIYESAYSALDLELTAPLHAVYMGINDFNLSSHRKSFSDATRNTFIGEFYSTYIANGGKDLAHELNDITSRAIIKGGSEKQRLRLLYSELKAKYLRLAIDMNASAWYSNTDTYKDSGTIPCYNFAPTYQNINTAIDDIWNSLHGLLNCYVDEFGELQIYDDQNEEYPFWLNDDNVNIDTDLNAMEEPYKQYKDITDIDFSLSSFYEETWRNVYEVFQEAEYAIDVFTRKIVDEAAVDGVLSGKEKSMLRTAFANEVNRYFEIKSELASFGKTIYKRDNSTPVTIDDVRDAINALGTYLNAGQAWKVEPMSGDASGTDYWHEGNDYVYPSMLTSASTTASTTIEASTYQTKWNDWFGARDEIVSDMAYARQKIVNDIVTGTVPPFYYVGATNPLEDPQTSSRVKDGDHWYKPVTLTNPTNGQTISNIDGKPIYDHYVCKTIEGGLDWVLLTAATQAVMSVADAIYLSVFDSSNSSSIVQLVNKITEKVSGTGITGANLILNSDFDTMADGNPEHFMKEGNVDWERTTEQMPTGFNHSLLITAGAGEGIRMQNPSQPKLRLDNERNYILSAFIRIASANNVTPILQVRRGVNASTNVLQELELEGDLWQRISLNITGDNIAEPIKFTLKTAGSFYITGIQLEKGSILTAWRKAEEDWQGSIDLLKDRINLSVTKDGLRQAGMEISGDDKSVTLFGKQVKVDGDLDLTGLTTENVTKIPYDITRPVVVNMGIFEDETDADNVTVKSVQFEARNVALDGTNTGIPRLVCLPFYDSAIESNDEDWKAQTNIAFSADNTFSIFADNSVPDSLKRIIQYKKTGTRITITNEAEQFAKNWQRLMDSANANNAQQDVSKLRGNAIVVCSDARLLAEENYDGEVGVYEFEKRLVPNDGYGVVPKWNGGLFSCGGYLARFIAVLPGQTLQLRSQIMKIDVYQEVLVWVVENPTEFVPMINPLIIDAGETVYLYGDSHDNTNPLPTVNFTSSYNGILDTWMGHEVLNKVEQSPFEIALER